MDFTRIYMYISEHVFSLFVSVIMLWFVFDLFHSDII